MGGEGAWTLGAVPPHASRAARFSDHQPDDLRDRLGPESLHGRARSRDAQPQPQVHDDRPLDQAQPQQEALYPSVPAEPPQLEDIVVAEPEGSGRGGSPGEYWVYISKGDCTLSLYRGNELVKNYSVAVGRNPGNKRRIGDNRTPVGRFRVQSIENSQSWKHDFGDGNGVIDGAYGPWFIRLNTGWKGIGIHGTHDPDSRGSMATEGCIRMSNEEVRELRRYAYRNMRVIIEE